MQVKPITWYRPSYASLKLLAFSDPYVKVSLMCRSKRIKKKKTTVKKNTLNPVYNEAIVFDVPNINVEEVYLIIKVVDYDRCAVWGRFLSLLPFFLPSFMLSFLSSFLQYCQKGLAYPVETHVTFTTMP